MGNFLCTIEKCRSERQRGALVRRTRWARRALVPVAAVVVIATLAAGCGSSSKKGAASAATSSTTASTSAPKTSRGFDGSTITVAGLGIKSQLPGVEYGAEARIKRFNDTRELPGVTIDYTEYADDKGDPAFALSEARRLVSQTKVFALVGDSSAVNPGDYFAQNHVPYFGSGYDNTFCSDDPVTTLWGFGYLGCIVASHPKQLSDTYREFSALVKEKTGKAEPTVAEFSSDTASGRNSAKFAAIQLKGRGFKVVYAKASVPPPPVPDFTPYVQQLVTSDGGHAPDAVVCLLAIDCLSMYKGLRAAGYPGFFFTSLYSDALLGALKGSYVNVSFQPFDQPNAGLTQMRADMTLVKPDYTIDIGVVGGYFAADMFIAALKLAAKSGGISPENVQAKAARMTWEIKGFVGPTIYPEATTHSHGCNALTYDDGTVFKTVEPFSCSDTTWPVTG